MRTEPTREEWGAIEANLFPEAAAWVKTQPSFPWHRDRTKLITATRVHSSQALAIDCFGTLAGLSRPSLVVEAWAERWGLPETGLPKVCVERTLPTGLLCEPRPTQVDASIEGPTGLLLFECKFTETDGGSCSQIVPRRWNGPGKGPTQCTGDYVLQTNPVNRVEARCALTGKSIRYWEVVPRVLEIDGAQDYRPCPFKGGWYQWMRNLVACAEISARGGKRGAVLVVYPEGPFPIVDKLSGRSWNEFQRLAVGKEVLLMAVSYQALLGAAIQAAVRLDRGVLERLRLWMLKKVGTVRSAT